MELTKSQEEIYQGKICPYCRNESKYVDSIAVYSKSYGKIYYCKECDAYVGVHKGTDVALGRLANKELRNAKIDAHKYFDHIWKSGIFKRKEAYKWLSKVLKIPAKYTHIGMFSVKTCQEVVFWSKQLAQDMKQLDRDFGVY